MIAAQAGAQTERRGGGGRCQERRGGPLSGRGGRSPISSLQVAGKCDRRREEKRGQAAKALPITSRVRRVRRPRGGGRAMHSERGPGCGGPVGGDPCAVTGREQWARGLDAARPVAAHEALGPAARGAEGGPLNDRSAFHRAMPPSAVSNQRHAGQEEGGFAVRAVRGGHRAAHRGRAKSSSGAHRAERSRARAASG